MIEFPAIWIWYGYLAANALLLFIALSQIINSMRHGSRMPLNIFISGIFVLGIAAMMVVTLSLLNSVDWASSFSLDLPSASFFRLGF